MKWNFMNRNMFIPTAAAGPTLANPFGEKQNNHFIGQAGRRVAATKLGPALGLVACLLPQLALGRLQERFVLASSNVARKSGRQLDDRFLDWNSELLDKNDSIVLSDRDDADGRPSNWARGELPSSSSDQRQMAACV